ncbi:MAG: polyprenyl diphosphate synthase [Candidatus Diapherotrites archaeon]|nr:polyprenyl diphosphate synthase [Candidatus Diapherotrites archaeon]
MPLSSIAFIPDGNRRFAQARGLHLLDSYQLGTQKAWDVLDWLKAYPAIKTGTFYTLSAENLSRNKTELSVLLKIFDRQVDKALADPMFEENQLRVRVIGDPTALPKALRQKLDRLEHQTENHAEKTVNLAIGYSGQHEIVSAAKKIAQQYKDGALDLASLTVDNFQNFLYSAFPNPDLIIRTSGTKRLSGFLTYQSAYSELYFVDKYWPEFSQQDLANAVDEFEQRERRFGK